MSPRRILLNIGLPFIFVMLISSSLCGSQLLDVVINGTDARTEITASFDGTVNYTEFTMENKIIFDLLKCESGLEANKYEGIDRGGVKTITLIPFYTANILRLTVDLGSAVTYQAAVKENKLVISFDNQEGKAFEMWIASEQEITPTSLGYEEGYEVPGMISLDLEDADIQTILRAMAHYGGKNVVAGEEVKGVITMKLSNVTWQEAFEVIVKTAGFSYREEKNILRVAKGTTFDKERENSELAQPVVHKVYKLSFANPKEVRTNVSKLISKKGTVEVDDRTNSLIVTDIESKQQDIKALLEILDSANPQVDIEVKVIDMDFDFGRNLGITWVAKNLRSKQYNIQASGTLNAARVGVLDLSIGSVRNFGKISSIINLYEKEGKTKVIANPRITALNNREAEILGGKKFPVNMFDQAGNVVTRYFEVGTRLKVTPHINAKNEITMDIEAELSNVDPTTLIITSTEASTRQLVRDGETVVLGGFVREETQQSEQGVPILRKIPILGYLFKSTGKTTKKREVLIFLTPHIVKYY